MLPVLFVVCTQAQAQGNATGEPAVTYASGINVPTEDSPITANKGTIEDPDSTPTTDVHVTSWRWFQADANGGTYTYAHAGGTFTPLQANVGKYLRVCADTLDSAGNTDNRCLQIATAVVAVNDAPTSDDASVNVSSAATAENPYIFMADDFPFMDEETSDLASVTIVETIASGKGTLTRASGSSQVAVTDGTSLSRDVISTLRYHPPANTTPAANFASFRFTVGDGDGTASSAQHTMTINLVSSDVRLRLRLFLEGPLR